MSVLSADNLMCIKRDRVLFESLNLAVDAGHLVHLKGLNGAGKTSLLRILSGLSQATEGQVFFNHIEIEKCATAFYQESLYIGHKSGVNGILTSVENTLFWTRQHGIDVEQSLIFQVLGELGLAGLEDKPVMQLSAGQQRRVALARLWLKSQAKLWFLDEPFTALDVNGMAILEHKMHQHIESGGSIITTSHQTLSDHINKQEFVLEYRF